MPELPEVENTRRYLIKAGLPGSSFAGADVGWPKALKTPALEDFVLGLLGATVADVGRRGKYILLPLRRGTACRAPTLILHLGMTGGLRVQPAAQPAHPMVRHTFFLNDDRELRFIDGRKFAKMWMVDDPEDVLPPLGADPLGADFTPEALSTSRPAAKLTKKDVTKLTDAIKSALTTALAAYDESREEQWPDPPMGLHTWSIPRKEGTPCPRCGGPISSTRIRARGTYFCPKCQR